MRVKWMFRATELLSGERLRGMLSIVEDCGEQRIMFAVDGFGGHVEPLLLGTSGFKFAGPDEVEEPLPSPGDVLCRDLGEVTLLLVATTAVAGVPGDVRVRLGKETFKPFYELRGRLPVTGKRQTTAVVAVEHPMSARGAGRG